MTDSAGLGVGAGQNPRPGARKVVLTLLRVLGANVATARDLLPAAPGSHLDRGAIALLGVGLSGLVVLIVFQVRGIIRAEYPVLRAVGALATSAPLFLLLFAGTYFVLGGLSASNFSESMTRTDALYFTVTVFATVGFGDITATSEGGPSLGDGADGCRHRDRGSRRQDHC